jgi:hypothetical protein
MASQPLHPIRIHQTPGDPAGADEETMMRINSIRIAVYFEHVFEVTTERQPIGELSRTIRPPDVSIAGAI